MSDKSEVLALIPARGGSKSIPRKNLLEMLGKPLLAWSIYHAQNSKHINRIIVSTDDEEIASVARKFGAEVPFIRPSIYATDDASDLDVFTHALKWLKKNENYDPDLVVHLRPTGPARRIDLIDEAISIIDSSPDSDSLRSVSLASQSPFKMWFVRDDNTMYPALSLDGVEGSHSIARQLLPKAYWQNGYVDIVKPHTVLIKNSMVGDNILSYIINDNVLDVDYFDDIPAVEGALKMILDGQSTDDDNFLPDDRHPV